MEREIKMNAVIVGAYPESEAEGRLPASAVVAGLDTESRVLSLAEVDCGAFVGEKDPQTSIAQILLKTRKKREPEQVLSRLSAVFRQEIDSYVFFDADRVLNAVKGVDIKLYKSEMRALGIDPAAISPKSPIHLDTPTAIRFLQGREAEMGTGQLDRQYRALRSAVKKLKAMDLKVLYHLVVDILPNLQTNIKKTQMVKLALFLCKKDDLRITREKFQPE